MECKHEWKQVTGGVECVICGEPVLRPYRTKAGSNIPDPPPVLLAGAGVIEDTTGRLTKDQFLDGEVPMELHRRFDQEHMIRVWWESLTRKDREDLWPLVQGATNADMWIGALRPAYGEWMRDRRARGQADERPLEPTHPGSDDVQ